MVLSGREGSTISRIYLSMLATMGFMVLITASCGDESKTTEPGDRKAPEIVSTFPAAGALSVSVSVAVEATFNEDIDSTTVTTSSFTLTPAGSGPIASSVTTNSNQIVLRPNETLQSQTTYVGRITTAVTDLAGNRLDSNYTWSFVTGLAPDSSPPAIVETIPVDGARDVPLDVVVRATFSKGMESSTLNATNIAVVDTAGVEITGLFNYNGATRILTFTPDDSLSYDAIYMVTIGTGVLDTFGIAIATPYIWSFATPETDKTPPEVVSSIPVNGAISVSVNSYVSAQFSELVDTLTISAASFSVMPDGGSVIDGTYSFTDSTVTFFPAASLLYSTEYTCSLTTEITDTAGNPLSTNFTWFFTTEIDPNSLPAEVVHTDPESNEVNVRVNKVITATLSKGMDAATITNVTVQLKDSTDSLVSSNVNYTPVNRTVSLTPDDSLDYNTRYSVTIGASVLDTFGVALSSDYTWSFVTEHDPITPVITLIWPPDNAILDDTITLQVDITAIGSIDSVVYFRDATRIGVSTANPYSLYWNVTGMTIGDPYTLSARVYDADGREGVSPACTVSYLWELVGIDINDPWPTDLRSVFARTTEDYLILRVQTSEPWNSYPYPYDTIVGSDTLVFLDTSFAAAIYLDSDRNPLTGRHDFAQINLNGIGADHRILIGFFGGDTTLSRWDGALSSWALVYDTLGLAFHSVPPDSNEFIIAVRWDDLNGSLGCDLIILNANLDLNSPGSQPVTDFIPVLGGGAIRIDRADRWLGDGFQKYTGSRSSRGKVETPREASSINNPFD